MAADGNLLQELVEKAPAEEFSTLLALPGLTIERIVSTGQRSPDGFWYDQAWDEWVLLLTGGAVLQVDDENPTLRLAPGDYLHIPAGRRHRVTWTDPTQPTVWLAIHATSRAD